MQRQLPGGLILRSLSEGYESDSARLPQFYFSVFSLDNDPEEERTVIPWTLDLMDGHPTVTKDDIFVVVDPAKDDMIVSATLMIPQVWRYEDVELSVGRPEIVATHPEYRRRGLVRALFDAVHERSAALGHNVLFITGIPNFYRQFGYTMAVDLGGHAMLNTVLIKPRETPQFTLRPATDADIPDMKRWSEDFARQKLLSAVYNEQQWHYELNGRREGAPWTLLYLVIVNTAGESVGYVALRGITFHNMINCITYIVGDKSSYFETFGDVIAGIKQWATERFGTCPAVLDFATGVHETVSVLIDRTLAGLVRRREYAYYMRIVDIVRFLNDIKPVLERRLEGSGAHRYTGTLAVGFYDKTGVTFQFENGCIKDITGGALDNSDIAFPYHMFLNVIFGYHTADEIRTILPDVWANTKAAVLLPILFPKKRSWLQPIC
ncbi:MAG: GNAT family N-acetyltransferase [Anaerolineae bacterium]